MWNLVKTVQAVSERRHFKSSQFYTFYNPCEIWWKLLKQFQRRWHLKTRWQLWWPSWISGHHNHSFFRSRCHPVATLYVSTLIFQWFWGISQKFFFKMAAVAAILDFWAQLVKANDIVNDSLKFTSSDTQMLKFFAEKMWVAFALQKLLTFFQQNISEYCILNPLKQLTKWPLTSSLS